MSARRVLVAGIGNVFLGDDGFGVEVVRRLARRPLPAAVRVVDFGIRGVDLAYALAECDAAILVDAVARGGAPGTLYVLEPELEDGPASVEMHAMVPERVLRWIDRSALPPVLRIVGCEPATFGEEGWGQEGFSVPVEAAVGEAVRLVECLAADLGAEETIGA